MGTDSKPSKPIWLWLILGVVFLVVIAGFIRSRGGENLRAKLILYGDVPAFALTNQHGQLVSNESLEGTVWISDVIFTRCPVQCLKLSAQMKKLQGELPDVKFVSLTADPEYDTPSVLKKYADKYGAMPGRWHFLTGRRDDVFRLAVNGFKFAVVPKEENQKEFPDDLFIHSTMFALVDKKGRLRGWFEANEPEAMQRLVQAAKYLHKRE